MNIDGEWTLEWGTSRGLIEAGVIKFESGVISGGNSRYTYSGTYQTLSAQSIQGSMEVTNKNPNKFALFGGDTKYKIYMKGDYGISESTAPRRALMVIDFHLDNQPATLIRLICKK